MTELSRMREHTLFVGITSWNSRLFLGHCIDAVRRTTDPDSTRVVVLDNASSDGSAELAADRGVEVVSRRCTQADALNALFHLSRSEYTLLIHSDVILLSEHWLEICAEHLRDEVVMVAPEDIGCGPYTRPWGEGMPESSFLLFRTAPVRAARRWFWRRRRRLPVPYRAIDLYGEHVTYDLPEMLRRRGLAWEMMDVHTSETVDEPIYTPPFRPRYWEESWGSYRYGLGNFYSLGGRVTHYHNWFDRLGGEGMDAADDATYPREGGLPLAYVRAYTNRFLADLERGAVAVPEIGSGRRSGGPSDAAAS